MSEELEVGGLFGNIRKLLDIKAKVTAFLDKLGLTLDDVMDLAGSVGNLPDWSDTAAIRAWLGPIVDVAVQITEATENATDDAVAAIVDAMMESDEVWRALDLLRDIVSDAPAVGTDDLEDVKFDPATWALIITMAVKVIAWLRERRQSRSGMAGPE